MLFPASHKHELLTLRFLLLVMMSNTYSKDGLAVLQSFIGQDGGSIAYTSTRSNTLDMEIRRDVQVLIVGQLVDHRKDVIEGMVRAIHNLKDDLTLFASMNSTLLALVNDTDIAYFYGRAKALEVTD